jgi:chloramphenicol O-acetyltransferase type B
MSFQYFCSKVIKKLRGKAMKDSFIHRTSKIESGSQLVRTTMAKHSFCGYDCDINYCNVGAFTSIANNVVIGGGMHPIEWVSTSPVFYSGRDSVKKKFSEYDRTQPVLTNIGNDVWIGQNVMIKQGVYVNDGAVIGMGAIVTKDVPPYAVVAGNPAKVIKMRFEKDITEALIQSKWWLLSDDELEKHSKLIKEPKKFLESLSL